MWPSVEDEVIPRGWTVRQRERLYLQTLPVDGCTGNVVTGQGPVEDSGKAMSRAPLAEVEKGLSEQRRDIVHRDREKLVGSG